MSNFKIQEGKGIPVPPFRRDLSLQQLQEDQTILQQVPPICVQGLCHTCAYMHWLPYYR